MTRATTKVERHVERLRKTRPFVYQALLDIATNRGLVVEDLVGHEREHYISEARQDVMLELRRQGWGVTAIGGLLGGRDHSTVCYGLRRAKAREEARQGAQRGATKTG